MVLRGVRQATPVRSPTQNARSRAARRRIHTGKNPIKRELARHPAPLALGRLQAFSAIFFHASASRGVGCTTTHRVSPHGRCIIVTVVMILPGAFWRCRKMSSPTKPAGRRAVGVSLPMLLIALCGSSLWSQEGPPRREMQEREMQENRRRERDEMMNRARREAEQERARSVRGVRQAIEQLRSEGRHEEAERLGARNRDARPLRMATGRHAGRGTPWSARPCAGRTYRTHRTGNPTPAGRWDAGSGRAGQRTSRSDPRRATRAPSARSPGNGALCPRRCGRSRKPSATSNDASVDRRNWRTRWTRHTIESVNCPGWRNSTRAKWKKFSDVACRKWSGTSPNGWKGWNVVSANSSNAPRTN